MVTPGDDAPFAAAVVFGPRSRALVVFRVDGAARAYSRAAGVLERLCRLTCSAGAETTARRQAAEALEPFMAHVQTVLAACRLLHVDETPVRTGAGLACPRVACNDFAAAMHVGGRSAADVDAGEIAGDLHRGPGPRRLRRVRAPKRFSRGRSGKKPGGQPGTSGTVFRLVDDRR